jgi:ATP synthase subunit 6
MLSHLVPQRTPNFLIPFIVIIELVRRLIRPMTLSVRLTANIIAGHLLIVLLGNQATQIKIFPILMVTQVLLIVLERSVAVIQSYVFSTLMTLYIRETPK